MKECPESLSVTSDPVKESVKKESVQRAIVIGGGPAGLSAGIALQKRGWEVQIFDSNVGGSQGFGWLIMPNGVEALKELGCKDAVINKIRPIEGAELYTPSGLEKVSMSDTYCSSREAITESLTAYLRPGTLREGRLEKVRNIPSIRDYFCMLKLLQTTYITTYITIPYYVRVI